MMPTRWIFRALGGAASVILVGCWTPAPYGYSTYPGYYGPPPNQGFVAPPGGTIVRNRPLPRLLTAAEGIFREKHQVPIERDFYEFLSAFRGRRD